MIPSTENPNERMISATMRKISAQACGRVALSALLLAVALAALLAPALVTAQTPSPAPGVQSIVSAVTGQAGETDPAKIVTAKLVANTAAIENGKTFMLGVHFTIAPGWHIYWANPGESGLDTKVEVVDFAQGQVGRVMYPAPVRFESPGPLVSYGYSDEVMLMIPVTPAFTGTEPAEVALKVKARWLMCSDRCIPGRTELDIRVPVGTMKAANTELFERFEALVPKAATPAGVAVTAKVDDKALLAEIRVTPPQGSVIVAGEGKGLAPAYFFPLRGEGVEPELPVLPEPDTKVATPGGQVAAYSKPFVIRAKAVLSEGAAPVLEGVLSLQRTAADGSGAPSAPEHATLTARP